MSYAPLPGAGPDYAMPTCPFCGEAVGGVEPCVMINTGHLFWMPSENRSVFLPSTDTALTVVELPNKQIGWVPENHNQGSQFFHDRCFSIVMGNDPFPDDDDENPVDDENEPEGL